MRIMDENRITKLARYYESILQYQRHFLPPSVITHLEDTIQCLKELKNNKSHQGGG